MHRNFHSSIKLLSSGLFLALACCESCAAVDRGQTAEFRVKKIYLAIFIAVCAVLPSCKRRPSIAVEPQSPVIPRIPDRPENPSPWGLPENESDNPAPSVQGLANVGLDITLATPAVAARVIDSNELLQKSLVAFDQLMTRQQNGDYFELQKQYPAAERIRLRIKFDQVQGNTLIRSVSSPQNPNLRVVLNVQVSNASELASISLDTEVDVEGVIAPWLAPQQNVLIISLLNCSILPKP